MLITPFKLNELGVIMFADEKVRQEVSNKTMIADGHLNMTLIF